MKVGDLVRFESAYPSHPNPGTIGLVIDIDHHPRNAAPVKVQWIDGNYDQYRNMNELKAVSESR